MPSQRSKFALHSGLLAGFTLVIVVVGVPVTLVGVLVFFFEGVSWPLLTGCGLLAVAAATAFGAGHRLLKWWESADPAHEPRRVFISYRTAEHSRYLESLAGSLIDEGYQVLVFGREEDGPTQAGESQDAMLRKLGLYQMGEVDSELQRGLVRCDAMIFCSPTVPRKISGWVKLQDTLDALGFWLLWQGGASLAFWQFQWYALLYGRRVRPAFRLFDVESWQNWELAVARELGLPTIKLVFAEAPDKVEDGEACYVRPNEIEADFKEHAIPRLRSESRRPLQVQPTLPLIAFTLLWISALKVTAILSLVAVGLFFGVRAVL